MQECDFAVMARIEREIGTGRYGPVYLIRMEIGGRAKLFAAKYYEYEDGCEELRDTFVEVLNTFIRIDHPCVANILYYKKPDYGRGPITRQNILREVLLNHFRIVFEAEKRELTFGHRRLGLLLLVVLFPR
jgi:hypothetical protein